MYLMRNVIIQSRHEKQSQPSETRKEVRPMSLTETIALLMLVLAAITLGCNLKK